MWRDYLHINEEGASVLLETFRTALAGIPTDDDLTGKLSDNGTEKPPSESLPAPTNKRNRSPLRELDGTTAKVAGKSCIFQDCSVPYTTSLCHFFSFQLPYRLKHDNKHMPFWKEFFRHLRKSLGIKKISELTTFARSCIATEDLPDAFSLWQTATYKWSSRSQSKTILNRLMCITAVKSALQH